MLVSLTKKEKEGKQVHSHIQDYHGQQHALQAKTHNGLFLGGAVKAGDVQCKGAQTKTQIGTRSGVRVIMDHKEKRGHCEIPPT